MEKQSVRLSAGQMSIWYHQGRLNKKSFIYRLKRRGDEVVRAIKKYSPTPKNILDLGTADGLMLSRIKSEFPKSECLGVELSEELARLNTDKKIKIIIGDAQKTDLSGDAFDVAICSALIGHVPDAIAVIRETRRVLKKDGIVIITTPSPFFEKLARLLHLLNKDEDHHFELYNLKRVINLLEKTGGFALLEQKKFMISPSGLPSEIKIEQTLAKLHLGFLMLNQLVIARKK